MFNPERLSLIVQPIGEGGLRFYSYQTDDVEATVTGAGYATNAADYGLRTYDLIFVSPLDGAADTYILAVDTIDADGHATLASPGPIGDLLAANNLSDVADAATALANLGGMAKSTYDPGNVAGDAFAMDNMVEGADTKILTAAERAIVADAVTKAGVETITGAKTFSTTAAGTTPVRIESSDASATGGPQLDLARTSASPAANDIVGILRVRGMNDAATEVTYANINTTILDPTAGSEDARLILQVPVAGVQTSAVSIANGMIVGAPTGAYQGTGTVNATGYYLNGVALPSFNVDGGFTLDTTTTPTINMGIVFGGTWKAANKKVVTSSGSLTGTYATEVIRWEGEGHTASGATNSGLPLFIEGKKTDYLTSTTEGQILGTYTTIYGGRKGDHAAHLFGARKVFDGTYDGSVLGIEGSVQKLDATGATTQHVQVYMGWGMYNPGGGLNFAPDGMLGFAVEPRVGETYAAFAAVERSDLSAAFEYVMAASLSRNNANIFFSVTGSGHASGSGRVWSNLGSAASPIYSFRADTNTGLYSPGADQVGIATGGTLRLTVSTTAVELALPLSVNSNTIVDASAGVRLRSYTAAALASAANAVNTTDKVAGKCVWDSTNNRILTASGSGATATWIVANGTVAITPA